MRPIRKTLNKLIDPEHDINNLQQLGQVVMNSLLFCRAKLQLKTQRIDDISNLLIQNQRAIVRLITHKETKTLISEIVKMRDTVEDTARSPYFPQNKTEKTMAM